MRILFSEHSIDGYPLVIACGLITKDSPVEPGILIHHACEGTKVTAAIIDCQAIQGALTPEIPESATPGYINPPARWQSVDDRFSRDLAYNRGGQLALFGTAMDAVHWFRQTRGHELTLRRISGKIDVRTQFLWRMTGRSKRAAGPEN